jgi:hypothetical protein
MRWVSLFSSDALRFGSGQRPEDEPQALQTTPTYQVATTAAIPEGMMAAHLNPQARMLVGSIFDMGVLS